MTRLNGNSVTHSTINGDLAALNVDRAVTELRRGRAVEITDGGDGLVLVALETVQGALIARLLAASKLAALILTAERAEAARLNRPQPGAVAIRIRRVDQLEALKAYAGMIETSAPLDPSFEVATWSGSASLVQAGFRLAKAGRLIPALIGFQGKAFADPSLLQVALTDVEQHAGHVRNRLKKASESYIPLTEAENSKIALFRDEHGLGEHVAVVIGEPDITLPVPVRLHSACLTGDLLGSLRCDCGEQLRTAVRTISELGGGVLLYLDQEGRGIGLANKLRAYSIQDTGLDTLDADRHLGFSADERTYDVAAAMLRELGITRVRLLTNNPRKIRALQEHDIEVVDRLPLIVSTNSHNERYLRAKRERAGHLADEPSN